jgi:hypothetical protein
VDFKPPKQLTEARACYEGKIPRLQVMLAGEKDPEQIEFLKAKIARLKDKYACVVMEEAYREAKLVDRVLHNTIYYIDLTNGNDANDGLAANNDHSWKTIEKYTSVTARSAGDIAYVRANTTQTKTDADIVFDEDGTFASPISIIGCDSVTNDPWGDASDVRPIVDFNDTNYQFNANGDDCWIFTRIDVRRGADASSLFIISNCNNWGINDCIFRESANLYFTVGIYISKSSVDLDSVSFYSNKTYNMYCSDGSLIHCNNSSFNGGAATTDYGLYVTAFAIVYLYNCVVGSTTTHDVASAYVAYSQLYAKNCLFSDSVIAELTNLSSSFFSEDHNQTRDAQYAATYAGVVTKDATIELDSLPSIKLTPNSNCANGLYLRPRLHDPFDFVVMNCPASETTITIKARETAAWSADPTADEFYFEASYLDHAVNATRSTVKSAQTLSGTNEISFTMTFTPAQVGNVYVCCYLKKYESGKSVNVSIKPSVS